MHCPRIFLLATFLLVCHVSFISCVTLEFYSGRDYTGFIKKMVVDKDEEHKCIMPGDLLELKSIKTDKCVMLYQYWDCWQRTHQGPPDSLYSYRVDNNTAHFDIREDLYKYNLFNSRQQDERIITSLHVCSDELGGGPTLKVDMYGQTYYQGDIVRSWKGVCKCENIPALPRKPIPVKIHSIDNHGNSIYIFNEENCRGEPTLIPAGHSDASHVVGTPGDDPVIIRSFRPAGRLDCLKLNASINKFKFSNGSLSGQPLEKNVQMASTQTLTNIGSLPMTQTIEFSKAVGNTVEYSVANAFTQIHSVGVSTDVETESKAGIPWVGEVKVKLSVKANYQYTNNQQQTKTNKTAVTETETVRVTTTVQVAACERCDVTGYIKIVRDFPINYTALAVVKGTAGEDPLTAGDIRSYLPPGMEYIRDLGEYGVLVSVDGSMQAEFSWRTFVTKYCEPVPNCGHNNHGKKTHQVIEVPFVKEASQGKKSCGINEFWLDKSKTCARLESSNSKTVFMMHID